VSEWFLAQVLQKNGLSLADVKEQNMKSGKPAPLSSRAGGRGGHVGAVAEQGQGAHRWSCPGLVKQYPDLIMDSFAFRKDFVDKYPATVKEFMKAYYDAFDWFQKNTSEGLGIVAKATSETADDVKADLETLTLFDLKKARRSWAPRAPPARSMTT